MATHCLCKKLRAGEFSDINVDEINLLLRSLPLLQQQGKVPRSLPILSTSSGAAGNSESIGRQIRGELNLKILQQLQESYPDSDIDSVLSSESANDRLCLFRIPEFQSSQPFSSDDDSRVDMYLSFARLDNNIRKAQLVKRLYALALFRSTGSESIDILVQRIARRTDCFEPESKIKIRLKNALRAGHKWAAMIDFCQISGIIWVLGKPRTQVELISKRKDFSFAKFQGRWEDANRATWTKGIEYLLRTMDLRTHAARYSPAVDQKLNDLNCPFRNSEAAELDFFSPSARDGTSPDMIQTGQVGQISKPERWYKYSDSTLLFNLLCCLDGRRVPRCLLSRGGVPMKRWNESGEVTTVPPTRSGIHDTLVDLLSDDSRLGRAVKSLVDASAIEASSTDITIKDAARRDHVKRMADPVEIAQWTSQARSIVCHAFPRDRNLEPMFGDLGRLQLPQLKHVLRDLDKTQLQQSSTDERLNISQALLAASYFSDDSWKFYCLNTLSETDHEFLASAAIRKSTLYRFQGDVANSVEALSVFSGLDSVSSPRMNALLGQFHISLARIDIQDENLGKALARLNQWTPLEPRKPSKLEHQVEFEKRVVAGRILQYQGSFMEALTQLESMCRVDDISHLDPTWTDFICSLADLYCEVSQPQKALHLLSGELKCHPSGSRQSLRMLLSLAEAHIRDDAIADAKEILESLKSAGNELKLTTFGDLRLHITLARIFHLERSWDSAIRLWSEALFRIRQFPLRNGHTSAIILQSMRHVLLEKIREQGSDVNVVELEELLHSTEEELATMRQYCRSDGCQYLFAGLGSYWLQYVQACMQNYGLESSKL